MADTITRDIAAKVLETVDAGLCSGLGKADENGRGIPGAMCVEAAVCFAMGLPHSDEPTCVSPAIRALKIRLNDSNWSCNAARAKGMRRLALAQLGSAGAVDDQEFARRVAELSVKVNVPLALRAAAEIHPDQKHRDALEDAAKRCEIEGSESAARSARSATWSAARSAAESAAWSAESAARSAAESAAWSAESAACDRTLSNFAEGVVQILIAMNAPGCQWLDLAPVEDAA